MKEGTFNPILLVFRKSETEQKFRVHFAKTELIFIKYFVGLLLFFNSMYAVRDLYFPTQREIMSVNFQLYVVIPFYLFYWISVFVTRKYFEQLTVSTLILAIFTILSQFVMLYLNGEDGQGLLSIILIVLVGIYTFSGVLFRESLFYLTPLILSLLGVFIFGLLDFSLAERTVAVMQYAMCVPGLLFIRYRIEYQQRISFYRHYLLQQEQNKLIDKNQEIQALSDLRKDLISVLAHDIRSPVSNLRSTLFLTGSQEISVDHAARVFERIEKQVSSVEFLVNDILVWIKSQVKDSKTNMEAYDLVEAMPEIWHIYGERFKEKDLEWIIDLKSPQVVCQPDMLKAVIRNLITNAIKFSQKGSQITLSSYPELDSVRISIADQGLGMTPEEVQTLRETFQSKIGTENEKGFGIGFKICAALVATMNSHLEVDSTPGKGTTISFLLSPPQ